MAPPKKASAISSPRGRKDPKRGAIFEWSRWKRLIVISTAAWRCGPGHALAEDGTVSVPDTQSTAVRSVFRPGHNLTLVPLIEQTQWRIRDTENLSGFAVRIFAPGVLFRYAFHINLTGNSGFALGTALAGYTVRGDLSNRVGPAGPEEFRPQTYLQLPSLSGALVQSLGSRVRLSAWGEYSALYFPSVIVRGKNTDRRVDLSIVPDSWSAALQSDIFFSPFLGVAAWAGYRSILSTCLGGCSPSAFINSVRFDVEGWQLGVGLTWQAGTFFDE